MPHKKNKHVKQVLTRWKVGTAEGNFPWTSPMFQSENLRRATKTDLHTAALLLPLLLLFTSSQQQSIGLFQFSQISPCPCLPSEQKPLEVQVVLQQRDLPPSPPYTHHCEDRWLVKNLFSKRRLQAWFPLLYMQIIFPFFLECPPASCPNHLPSKPRS